MIIDYDIRKQLDEAWLIEMALPRADVITTLESYESGFKIHVAKCFLFRNTQWYEHWIKEAANFCIKCDDLRLKPKAKRPDKDLYLEYFVDEMENASDAKTILGVAIARCPEIERDDQVLNSTAFIFVDFWNDLREELADYLSDEETFDRSVYIDIIDNAIKRYPIEE